MRPRLGGASRSPPCTRLRATIFPSIPTPMIAVVMSFSSVSARIPVTTVPVNLKQASTGQRHRKMKRAA